MLRKTQANGTLGLVVQADFRHSRRTSVSKFRMTLHESNHGTQTEKMALFIDGANLYATAKSLGSISTTSVS